MMTIEGHSLQTWEILELLKGRSLGRLCVSDCGCPIALPVNYRLVDEHLIVVRTEARSVIGRYEGLASLQIDQIELDKGTAWSVIARGSLVRLHDQTNLPDPQPWLGGDRFQWMGLKIASLTARRFAVRTHAGDFTVEWAALPQ